MAAGKRSGACKYQAATTSSPDGHQIFVGGGGGAHTAVITKLEHVDPRRLQRLIRYLTENDPYHTELARLKAYADKVRYGKVVVEYVYSEDLKTLKLGRLYAKHGVSLQMMKRDIWSYLAKPFGFDLDFENCQPRLISQAAAKMGIPCKVLTDYVNRRDHILERICDVYEVDRDTAKTRIISLLFLGTVSSWEHREVKLGSRDVTPSSDNFAKVRKYLLALEQELYNIAEQITLTIPDMEAHQRKIKPGGSRRDILAGCLSTYCLTEENKMIMALNAYMERHGREVLTLIYDGAIIAKESPDEEAIPGHLIEGAQDYVRTKTGYSMRLVVKPFKSPYDDLLPEQTPLTRQQMDQLDYDDAMTQLRENFHLNYTDKKYLFERYHAKVRNPPVYVTFADPPSTLEELELETSADVVRSYDNMNQAYNNVFYIDPEDGKEQPFFAKWVVDPFARQYERMDFLPPPLTCKPSTLNMWSSFAVEKMMQGDASKGSITMFLQHLSILVDHDPASVQYVVKWIAHMFQHPGHLNGIALVFISQQGAGKNIFIDLLSKLIGERYFFESSAPKTDLFAKHANGRFNKLLINMDEVNRHKLSDNTDEMKNMITSKYLTYEPKNVNMIKVRNFNRFILTSNHDVAIKVEDGDRRYAIFRSSSEKVGDMAYFASFNDYMTNPDNLKAIYAYLMSIDVSTFNWITARPDTDQARLVRSESVCYLYKFLERLVVTFNRKRQTAQVQLPYKELAAMLESYCRDKLLMKDYSVEKSKSTIGNTLKRVPGISKASSSHSHSTVYCFDVPTLTNHLTSKGLLGEFAYLFVED